ncbi:MAG TPA: SGNH/GDSL hydrolase family protein [Stellaceae bacterium]|nr:SGNH/GDSL hydrolase family protein [Stellaceae bacterium]
MTVLKRLTANVLLVAISVGLSFGGLEAFLWVWAGSHSVQIASGSPPIAVPQPTGDAALEIPVPPEIAALAKQRQELLTMPEEFKRRPATVSGAVRADYWQGALEVYNADGLRWATPYPAKRPDTYRVMVVGDSLTYGDGLAEKWRFSNLTAAWLQRQYRIEVVNLGHDGYQSEDVLREIEKFVPQLHPNLVLYAVCLNDFLPSGAGEYYTADAYPFPLPAAVKNFLIKHTRSGAFLNELYDGTLRRLHLRADFFDDILADFGGYQNRFARDVANMNKTVRAAGLPPLLAMVVDQYPSYGGRGYRIAMVAEKALAQAGATVIPTEDYYRRYSNQPMHITRWEGHPNEVANIIWANMIIRSLRSREDLQAYKRDEPQPSGEAAEK